MSSKILEELLKSISIESSETRPNFKPHIYLRSEDKTFVVWLEDVAHYYKWVNSELGLYLADDNNRIVGVEVYNPTAFDKANQNTEHPDAL